MGAEDQKKKKNSSDRRRKAVGWRQVKRALKLLFERRLGAEISEMQLIASTWPPEFPSLMVVCIDEERRSSVAQDKPHITASSS